MTIETDWKIYGVCSCGWFVYAPVGDLFHIHKECCPRCGTLNENWTLKKMRHVYKSI